MTEAEWLECRDPGPMIEFVRTRSSARKLRLFACACARRLPVLGESEDLQIVALSERLADGQANKHEVQRMRSRLGGRGGYSANWAEENAIHAVLERDAQTAAKNAGHFAADFCLFLEMERTDIGTPDAYQELLVSKAAPAKAAEKEAQACILREIFGNPLRPATIDPAVLVWASRTLPRMALGIYDNRAFDRLPILADALEDAGCDTADILGHCRGAGPHVRGCWVIDLVLSKDR
jgi:hypothetical protein